MRALPLLFLLTAAAQADLGSDVKRSFLPKEPAERLVRLREARKEVPGADPKARNRAAATIEKALKKEPHPEVRRAALDFLLLLRTERALDRLVAGVLDQDATVARHVHEIVRDHADPMLHQAIVRALKEDASWRFRARAVDLLLSGGREAAKAPLVEALADEHPGVRGRAAEALERLTGEAHGVDAERWKLYFEAEARKKAAAARRDPDQETRTVADQFRKVEIYEGPLRGLIPTLYTIPIDTKRVIFVVDMSSSMRSGVRSTHFEELKQAIFGLASDVRFNVLCFDQRMFFFAKAKSLVPATLDEKVRVERWLNELPAGERTDVYRSVTTGLAMLREALDNSPDHNAELFVLTDGRETESTTSMNAVWNQYNRLPRQRCQVHMVALGRKSTPALRSLAQQSGGQFVEAPK